MVVLFTFLCAFGLFVSYVSQFENTPQAEENIVVGIVYAVISLPVAIIFAVGICLPRKSWNWVVGIIYIAISLMSCCFYPFTIPLLIYWLKPETKAFLGRK